MSAWAKPGVKCVCISNWAGHQKWYLPKLMATYTVDAVDLGHQDGPMLVLEEISAPQATYKFPVDCFRPLITRTQEQDVQMILSLLEPAGVDA